MAKTHAEIQLTGRECDEILDVLGMVLTSVDQFDTLDFSVLKNVASKIAHAVVEAVTEP